jgi:hypothetical protein
MGWETRGNGQYYYRKVRAGGRVRSEYLGAGPWVVELADVEGDARSLAEAERRAWRAEVDAERRAEATLAEVDRIVRDLAAAVLIAAGCHTHRRQWRRQR